MLDKFLEKGSKVANSPKQMVLSSIAILIICSAGYWAFEGEGPIRSLWWAIVTASTVGYGDAYPETTAGRGVAVVLIISMVTLILPMITALFTAKLLVDRDAFTHEEQEEIKQMLVAIAAKLDVETPFDEPGDHSLKP